MSNERKYFGTDGIRGIAGASPLEPESLVYLGKAIARVFLRNAGRHRILIGKDTRLSGYMIENALSAGITSMGAEVVLVGPIPTPGVAYLTRSMRADAGIVVSASHNPFEDNGIKIFGSDGYKLPDEIELQVEKLMENRGSELTNYEISNIGKASRIDDAVGRYTVFLKGTFPRELSLEGLKVGLDAAHGAGYIVAPQTLTELGAEVTARGVNPNGRNINAGFGSLYPEVVSKLVTEQNLDIGIALDGDADRVVVVDERGKILDGDELLAICAVDLKERGKLKNNAIVATVMSNLGLEKTLGRHGIIVHRSAVGDRYVLEDMIRLGCNLGGEQSGHMIALDETTSGDGILSALMILAVMLRRGKKLSELSSDFVRFPQRMVNVRVMNKPPLDTLPTVQSVIRKKEEEVGDKGRILVRYSGTENKVRVMVECEDDSACKKHVQDIAEVIEKELGVA